MLFKRKKDTFGVWNSNVILTMKTILEKREFIRSVKPEAKDDFLFELMHGNDRLLARFEEFVKSFNPRANHARRELNVVAFEDELQQAYEAFKEGLEELNFDHIEMEKWLSVIEDQLEEADKLKEAAKLEAMDYFEAWRIDLMTEISSGYHFQGLAIIVGMTAATVEARIRDSNLILGYPLNDYFVELLNTELEKLIKNSFETIPIEDSDILSLSECIVHFARNHTIGLLKHLNLFFDALVKSTDLAKAIIKSLDENSIPLQIIPKLADLLTTKTEDEQIWLNMAEAIFPDDYELAIKLLNYYYEIIPEDFELMAMKAFNLHGLAMASFLDGKIKEGSPLFCRYTLACAGDEQSLKLYDKARKFITREDGIAFAKDHPDFDFKLRVLKKEKAWEEILLLSKSKQAADQLHELLPLIMDHFPAECLSIIESNAAHVFRHHRNRDGYTKLAGYLRLAAQIPGIPYDINDLITQYIDKSNRLPALKDELRINGFLNF